MYHDEDFIVIKDKFPKAKVHWLLLPRQEMPEEVEWLTASHVGLLERMCLKLNVIEELARKELEDESIQIWRGFHSWPSMKLLHLHVISSDLQGSRMTTTSHWISFTTPFFITLETMLQRLKETGLHQVVLEDEKKRKKGKPTCPLCLTEFHGSDKGVRAAKKHYDECRKAKHLQEKLELAKI